ncbi:MAG: hypothetical protein EHM45_15290 [Desulfobacteraceae bacterium]|nr:MAG: hypothetical protein EHM45_15290 [Desulfobacteraceae bacterium]
MITMRAKIRISRLSGEKIYHFMLHPTNEAYRQWWPGTHLAFHTIKRFPDNLGNLVFFDEYVGKRRLTFKGVVKEAIPGKRIVWQVKKIWTMPARVSLDFKDFDKGVEITHTLSVAFKKIINYFKKCTCRERVNCET